jgi:hypothetical protein
MDLVRLLRKISQQLCLANLCVNGATSAIAHRLSYTNEMARNAPKHEFWVQWSGSGAFVAKNFDATLFSELVRYWHQFGQFCINFRAVTKPYETHQNMSSGSNGVDHVRSLPKF